MDTNVLDWLEVTAAACPDKPAFLDEDGAVTFADVRREARIIGTAAARLRAGRKAPIAVMSGRNAHTPAVFLGAVPYFKKLPFADVLFTDFVFS